MRKLLVLVTALSLSGLTGCFFVRGKSRPAPAPTASEGEYKNHGQERSEEVHARNEERKAEHDAAKAEKKEEKADDKAKKQAAKDAEKK